jgi:hypothetical protein
MTTAESAGAEHRQGALRFALPDLEPVDVVFAAEPH